MIWHINKWKDNSSYLIEKHVNLKWLDCELNKYFVRLSIYLLLKVTIGSNRHGFTPKMSVISFTNVGFIAICFCYILVIVSTHSFIWYCSRFYSLGFPFQLKYQMPPTTVLIINSALCRVSYHFNPFINATPILFMVFQDIKALLRKTEENNLKT